MENASKLGYKSIIQTSLDITSISLGNNCSYNGYHGAILKKKCKMEANFEAMQSIVEASLGK